MTRYILGCILIFFLATGCASKHLSNEYYKSGKLKRRLIMTDSKIKCLEYYENGKIESEGELLPDGHRVGDWMYYNEDGSSRAQGEYNDGLKEGIWSYNIGDSSYKVDWNIYLNRPVKINVPDDWVLKEKLAPSVPLAGFNDSSNWTANFNIVILNREGKNLDSVINETIRKGKENSGYSINVLSIKEVEINATRGKEVTQHLLADGKSLIVVQYFLEQSDTVYLLSFFVDENKRMAYDNLIKEIAYSFTLV